MFHDVIIGIPKEIMKGENRVAASPDTVKKMVAGGARVFVETMAGVGSFFSDDEFKAAGASIETNVESLYKQAHIILKVKEPLFHEGLNKHEVDLFHPGQYLITFLHPASPVNHEMIKNLATMDVTSFTLDGIPRISRAQNMDALTSMSTVAGYKSVLMAANRLSKFMPMIGSAVGAIKPAQVVVVGAGVCGLQAIATAKRLGAVVTAVDIRPDACEQAKSLGSNVWDVGVPDEVAIGQGGYAQRLSDEWLNKERENLKEAVKKADILILCALIPGKQAPLLVTEDMVKSMANGSSIVDVAIDQGGNCACTVPGKVENVHGVTIDGTKNIPGMVPTSSTWMFAQNIYNFLVYVVKDGKIELNREDEIIASSLTTYKKEIVHAGAREAMNL